jgi:hypothetical protein
MRTQLHHPQDPDKLEDFEKHLMYARKYFTKTKLRSKSRTIKDLLAWFYNFKN